VRVGRRSSQPQARGLTGFAPAASGWAATLAPAPALPNLQRSGHQAAVTLLGVNR